ncbi:MAG TPA: hypothetical protein VH165_32385 [Kofleriaceae bacterium]|jgi:hypothetical protein|nr:hypothetical protein [Kofleriaceae bacterium]
MTAPQSDRVAALLKAKDPADIRGWLARLGAVLDAEPTLDPATIDDLVDRGRPRWGTRTPEDATSYVAFWTELARRHPTSKILGGYADVLLLLGGRQREREALDVYLKAASGDPDVFRTYAGDFSDVAKRHGSVTELAFELATIRFYARLVDRDDMEADELQQAVRELLAKYPGNQHVRQQLDDIARTSSRLKG